jgi:hypothetical protein
VFGVLPCGAANCEAFEIIFKRVDKKENATYIGDYNVEMKGEWVGIIEETDFNFLAQLMVDNEFLLFNNTYTGGSTDVSTVYTGMSWTEKGITQTKLVKDYGRSGPQKLRIIEDSIVNVAKEKIRWTQESGNSFFLFDARKETLFTVCFQRNYSFKITEKQH